MKLAQEASDLVVEDFFAPCHNHGGFLITPAFHPVTYLSFTIASSIGMSLFFSSMRPVSFLPTAMGFLRIPIMPFVLLTLVLHLFSSFSEVAAQASTDTITWGGDNSRAGYQNNHNMDPAVVGSSQFGRLWRTKLPGNYNNAAEQIFSQPLVYTLADEVQYVFLATTQNNIYKINAKTGAIVQQRSLHVPFLTSDLDGCGDITPLIGITATGVIDPSTGTWYLTAKTYLDQNPGGARGRLNGRYYIHAIDTNTLAEKPNFPVNLEGMVAGNNPIRSFNGGAHHQRPALLHTGQYVYAGFASHCVLYNFTGWIVGWDKTSGALVERFATEGGKWTSKLFSYKR